MIVLYDARCGFCRQSRHISEALDWFGLIKWEPNPQTESSIVVLSGENRLTHWKAVKKIAVRLPLTWLLVIPSIALLPVFNPIGEKVYRWIALNRYCIGSNNCRIE